MSKPRQHAVDLPEARPQSARSAFVTLIQILLLAAPIIWTGMLVYLYGVNIPYKDQWDGECALFEKMASGTLGLADFFAQHNEHRIFFPRLIFYALDNLTHGNVRVELFAIQFLAAVVLFNVWRMMRVTGWTFSGLGFWLLFAASILIFSPLSHENFLFGFQIGFLLPVVCVTACLWVVPSTRPPVSFLATMVICSVCTFSVGNGFTCWALALPLLLYACKDEPWNKYAVWWGGWLATFAGNLLLYFYSYVVPPNQPSMWEVFDHPILALQYWLTYLGLPFAFGTALDPFAVAQVSAAIMLILLAWCLIYVWRRRHDSALVKRCLPWLVMIAAALVDATLTTVGRVGYGLWQALASRYVIFSILLPIGLCFLAAAIYQDMREREKSNQSATRTAVALAFVASALVVLHLLGAMAVAQTWPSRQYEHLTTKALVETINIVDEPELLDRYVCPIVPPLKRWSNLLDKIGFLNPGLIKSNAIADIVDSSQTDGFGQIDQAGKNSNQQDVMVGWAVLLKKERPADAVLLTYDDSKGESIIFAVADVGRPRTDVSQTLKDDAYLRSGWAKTFDPNKIPPDAHSLKAWAFDAENARAYPLKGAVNLPP